MMTRPSQTVHLNACGLEEIPKYLFLDTSIHTLHLTKNYLIDKSASLDQSGHAWLTDLKAFTNLTQLSLRDNKLESFPISICSLKSLTDLNISSNRIKEIPPEIGHLERYKNYYNIWLVYFPISISLAACWFFKFNPTY